MQERWEDNSPWIQARIIAFHQRACFEDVQASTPKKSSMPPPARSRGGGKRSGRR